MNLRLSSHLSIFKNSLPFVSKNRAKTNTKGLFKDSREIDFPRRGFKSVIGLEIHAQLSTESKLFSSAPNAYELPTNEGVALFDAAIPGTLPRLNKRAVELAVMSAQALGCKVNPISEFDRKHYFYFDLPSGYQITQQRVPLAENGFVEYAIYQPGVHQKPYYKTCRIKQIQLEQDSGKALHDDASQKNYVDLNRAGIPLIEIVFLPEIEDGEEAVALVKEVISILERVGSCSCKLEEGALRIDVNVSLSKGNGELGTRTEIKNVGSVHGVSNAVRYEVNRQAKIIAEGGTVENVTLAWDSTENRTVVLRDKEVKQDYRFMPEPNLPPLRLLIDEYSERAHKNVKSKSFVLDLRHLRNKIIDSPQTERRLLIEKFGLDDVFAYNIVNQKKLFKYFIDIMKDNSSRDPKIVYLLLMYDLLNVLKLKDISLSECFISAKYLGQVIDMLQDRRINKLIGNRLLEVLLNDPDSPSPVTMVDRHNLGMISSEKELRKICLRVVEKERDIVDVYRRKKKKSLFNDLMKKAIEESKFRADTKMLPSVMADVLDDNNREK